MTTEPIRILLVDDTPENLVALEALLRRPDVELLKARSGAAALELLLQHEFALALLDVHMPEMDGFELAELMRGMERTKQIPIIFVTAGTHDPSRVFQGYDSGAVDFLFKPIDSHILRSKVGVFLELARQRRELTQALRLNEMFLGVIGHDLRNPLNALVAGVGLLQRLGPTEPQRCALEKMSAAGRRLTEMIEQLVDLTRMRLGGGIGFLRTRKFVDTRELVLRTADELRVAHPSREIVIAVAGETTTVGDPDRLLQMFSNVVCNAVVHGRADGPVEVTISGGADEIVVRVANPGAIPEALLPWLFEPFQQRPQRNVRSGGLGLGMFISRQIARAHDGDITVAVAEDRTIVTIRISRTIGLQRDEGARPPAP